MNKVNRCIQLLSMIAFVSYAHAEYGIVSVPSDKYQEVVDGIARDYPKDIQEMVNDALSACRNGENAPTLSSIMQDGEVVGYILVYKSLPRELEVRLVLKDFAIIDMQAMIECLILCINIMPNVEMIRVVIPQMYDSIAQLLLSVDFKPLESSSSSFLNFYELPISNRCNICKLMYGDKYWEQILNRDDSQDDDDDQHSGKVGTF